MFLGAVVAIAVAALHSLAAAIVVLGVFVSTNLTRRPGHSLGHSCLTDDPADLSSQNGLGGTRWTKAFLLVIGRSSVRIRPRAPKLQVGGSLWYR